MENLFGFIIFLVIIIISIINKIRTEGGESQIRGERRDRQLKLDDIPEATRRMLYGDGSDIPVAKPRTAASEHRRTVVSPHPVEAPWVEVEQEEGQKPVPFSPPPPPPVIVVPHPIQQQPAPRMIKPPLRPAAPARQVPSVVRPPQQQVKREYPQQQRQQMKPRAQPAIHRPVTVEEPEGPKKKPVPAKQKQQMRPTAVVSSGAGLHGLIASKNDLARGILLREILGPPKAYEDFGY